MIGYIYHIINNTTNKHYIGITEDINRRLVKHKSELRNHTHHSPKLQKAWDYYGEKDFTYSFREVTINCYEDLYDYEIEEIKKYDSYNNGYNCNTGGKISDWKQKVKDEDIVGFLCFQSYYGSGYGKTFEECLKWSKGTASAGLRKVRYINANCQFEKLNSEQIKKIAEDYENKLHIKERYNERQLRQGGCAKAYNLNQDDYNFAFAAQELGYGYTSVANYLEIKPSTVKDWFNGRSRKKNKEIFDKLTPQEKEIIYGHVKTAELSGKAKS